ncbi:hypothetical protein SPF06_09325 [Sinomonas sp. JGH33]|uniref:Alkaline shock response membrane anchor protein AmaP n=1 Tax=Sinomonas terricola TaxID=3110330 RepID=A0ABU5T5X8_9MICC|nr:hypothetical protein [Sinomonas sp. JGH33]MEA5454919.1 hypothetical protein [Sinomonas sp. JGH33]
MNGTPRVLNRVLVLIFGAVVAAAGVFMVLLAAVPAVGAWWATWAPSASLEAGRGFASTWIPGTHVSWLWILAMALLACLILLMVWWMAKQGTGRRDLVAWSAPGTEHGSAESGEAPGRVAIAASTVDQALRNALAYRRDLLGTSVAAVEFEGRIALRLRVVARQGADPQEIAREVERIVTGMDLLLGHECPVLLHIASGTRARFSRAERVR